mgnify:CR=1 FL=1
MFGGYGDMDAAPARRPGLERSTRRILFLDDSSVRAHAFLRVHPGAVWAKSAAECVRRLSEPWDEVHLDYDLGWTTQTDPEVEESGMGVVYWIIKHKPEHLRRTAFVIHSHSRNASHYMADELRAAGYYAIRRPFDHATGD